MTLVFTGENTITMQDYTNTVRSIVVNVVVVGVLKGV